MATSGAPVMWQCLVCGYLMEMRERRKHVDLHFGTRNGTAIRCFLCTTTFPNQRVLMGHITATHFHQKRVCEVCQSVCNVSEVEKYCSCHDESTNEESASSRDNFVAHVGDDGVWEVSVVPKSDGMSVSVDDALSSRDQLNWRPENNAAYQSMQEQYRDMHVDGDPSLFWCEICQKVYREAGLDRHTQLHRTEQAGAADGFICPACDLQLHAIITMGAHIRVGHTKKLFTCWLCDEVLVCNLLKSHLIQRHGTARISQQNALYCISCEVAIPVSVQNTHISIHHLATKRAQTCVICFQRFEDVLHVKSHIEETHFVSLTEANTSETSVRRVTSALKPLMSSQSTGVRLCTSPSDILNLIQMHIGEIGENRTALWCVICQEVFPRSTAHKHIRSHAMTQSSKYGFKCPACVLPHDSRASLYLHMRWTHVQVVFKCYLCSVTLISDLVKYHMNTCHADQCGTSQQLVCSTCWVAVPPDFENCHAGIHIQRIPGENRYMCLVCFIEYQDFEEAKKHLHSAHCGPIDDQVVVLEKLKTAESPASKKVVWVRPPPLKNNSNTTVQSAVSLRSKKPVQVQSPSLLYDSSTSVLSAPETSVAFCPDQDDSMGILETQEHRHPDGSNSNSMSQIHSQQACSSTSKTVAADWSLSRRSGQSSSGVESEGQKFRRQALEAHRRRVGLCCRICNVLLLESEIKRHISGHVKHAGRGSTGAVYCPYKACMGQYRASTLYAHIEDKHVKKAIRCWLKDCKVLVNRSGFGDHMKRAHSEIHLFGRNMRCSFCEISMFESLLALHAEVHVLTTADETFQCLICDDYCSSDKALAVHHFIDNHCETPPALSIQERIQQLADEQLDTRVLWCEVCGDTFASFDETQHLRAHIPLQQNGTAEQSLQCPLYCSDGYGKAALLNHLSSSHVRPTYQCWICDEYLISTQMKEHMTSSHTDYTCPASKGNIECLLCAVMIPEVVVETHVDVHIKEMQRGRFKCPSCTRALLRNLRCAREHYLIEHTRDYQGNKIQTPTPEQMGVPSDIVELTDSEEDSDADESSGRDGDQPPAKRRLVMYVCSECDYKCSWLQEMRNHVESHMATGAAANEKNARSVTSADVIVID